MPSVREHLTRAQRAELEQVLIAERSRIERFIPSHASASAADEGDPLGLALATVPAAVRDRRRQVTDTRYQAVVDALQRLRNGSYGICTRCRSPIPFGRLIVLPESDHCVACGSGY